MNLKIRNFLWWYTSTLIGLNLVALIFLISTQNINNRDLISFFWVVSKALFSNPTFYLIALIPYLIYVVVKSLIRDYRNQGLTGLVRGASLKTVAPFLLLWGSAQLMEQYRYGENFEYDWDYSVENTSPTIKDRHEQDLKQRGIHVMNLHSDTTDLEILKTNNIEWITFVPFVSQEDYNTPSLRFRHSASNTDRWEKAVKLTRKYGFKTMIKPHIWLNNRPGNIWRSNIQMKNDTDWSDWFESYSRFIIGYAQIAEDLGVDQFCIGTELNTSVMEKPDLWLDLIKQVRDIYSGKITYAANWDDDLENISLWRALDFIGVQAYFPIAKNSNPRIEELEDGWRSHYSRLESLKMKFDKPLLFTELGYKSTKNAGQEPWEWNTLNHRFYKRISHKTQALCYQAFFNTIWQQPWFAGAHIWEWQAQGSSDGNNNSFTLEGKPALNVVAKGFY